VKAVWRQMLGTLMSTAVGFSLRLTIFYNMPPFRRTALLAFLYLATYLALVVGLLRVQQPMRSLFSLCEDLVPSALIRGIRGRGFFDRKGLEHP
jgi:hypothetical protein